MVTYIPTHQVTQFQIWWQGHQSNPLPVTVADIAQLQWPARNWHVSVVKQHAFTDEIKVDFDIQVDDKRW